MYSFKCKNKQTDKQTTTTNNNISNIQTSNPIVISFVNVPSNIETTMWTFYDSFFFFQFSLPRVFLTYLTQAFRFWRSFFTQSANIVAHWNKTHIDTHTRFGLICLANWSHAMNMFSPESQSRIYISRIEMSFKTTCQKLDYSQVMGRRGRANHLKM